MAKYVVFAGRATGTSKIDQIEGYMSSWIDQGILDGALGIRIGDIANPSELEFLFPKDERIKKALGEMDLPAQYLAACAKVRDEIKLRQVAPSLCYRYNLNYRVYEVPLLVS